MDAGQTARALAPGLDGQAGAASFAVRGRSIAALEGLRGVAIAAVVLFHLEVPGFVGGFLGVNLFFVLSGFLITSLLIEEHLAQGRLDLAAFWVRRAKRLLPALCVLILGMLALANLDAWVNPGRVSELLNAAGMRGDALAGLFFVANWQQVWLVDHGSLGGPHALAPYLWSLSVEEQFYLLWPIVTLGLLSLRRWRQPLAVATCALGAMASTWALWHAFFTLGNEVLAYMGTTTQAFNLLIGAGLAWLTAGRPQPSARARRLLAPLAGVALVAMAAYLPTCAHRGSLVFPDEWMYRFGYPLFALLCATVLADARQLEPSRLGRALAIRPLTYLGRISYGLYLFHAGVVMVVPLAFNGPPRPWQRGLELAVSILLADLSYRFIERPLRRSRLVEEHRWVIPATLAAMALTIVVATSPLTLRAALG